MHYRGPKRLLSIPRIESTASTYCRDIFENPLHGFILLIYFLFPHPSRLQSFIPQEPRTYPGSWPWWSYGEYSPLSASPGCGYRLPGISSSLSHSSRKWSFPTTIFNPRFFAPSDNRNFIPALQDGSKPFKISLSFPNFPSKPLSSHKVFFHLGMRPDRILKSTSPHRDS